MMNLIATKVAPSFDDPLAMLLACHERIRAQCATIHKLVLHLPQHGCDAQARQATVAVLRYFDSAGQQHHQDEELDLFPLLLTTRNQTARPLISQLLNEHETMNAAWKQLRPHLIDISENNTDQLDALLAERFIDAYNNHIELENTSLLPLAKTLLTNYQLENLGIKMSARRGVTIPTLENSLLPQHHLSNKH